MSLITVYKQASFGVEAAKAPRLVERPYGQVVEFEGWLSKALPDHDNDYIPVEAWKAGGGVSAERTHLLWQHQKSQHIGKWNEVGEDTDEDGVKGIYGVGEANLQFELGKQAGHLLLSKAISGLSVGFSAKKDKIETKEIATRKGKRKVRQINEAYLKECSVVSDPCLDEARISKSLSSELLSAILDGGVSIEDLAAMIAKEQRETENGRSPAPKLSKPLQKAASDMFLFKDDDGDFVASKKIERALREMGLSKAEVAVAMTKGIATLIASQPTLFDQQPDKKGDEEAARKAAEAEEARKAAAAAAEEEKILKGVHCLN